MSSVLIGCRCTATSGSASLQRSCLLLTRCCRVQGWGQGAAAANGRCIAGKWPPPHDPSCVVSFREPCRQAVAALRRWPGKCSRHRGVGGAARAVMSGSRPDVPPEGRRACFVMHSRRGRSAGRKWLAGPGQWSAARQGEGALHATAQPATGGGHCRPLCCCVSKSRREAARGEGSKAARWWPSMGSGRQAAALAGLRCHSGGPKTGKVGRQA